MSVRVVVAAIGILILPCVAIGYDNNAHSYMSLATADRSVLATDPRVLADLGDLNGVPAAVELIAPVLSPDMASAAFYDFGPILGLPSWEITDRVAATSWSGPTGDFALGSRF
ncbi:MAG: hypothetical protein U0807_08625 [Candidatus Binatia bacterium]